MSNSIQIAENIQFLDEDRGRCLAPLLAGVLSASANTRPANNPNSRKLARDGGRKSICFFFAMWYLASRNEFALDGTVYSRLQKSPRFREVTIRDNSASEVKS
jgi:hypothetical protein